MECKRCTKKIDEFETYCEECKKVLNNEKEYNELVDQNKKLNELEATIEIETITDLKDDIKENIDIKEDTKEIKVEENLKRSTEDMEEFKDINKNNKKKIILIISVILVVITLIIIAIILIFNKEKNKEEVINVDYKKIINQYGDSIKDSLNEYLKDNEEVPSWSTISDLVKYDEYKIECKIHKLYKDGNIYLNDCKVDNKKVKYSYGEEQEEIIGKEITIYKINNENNYISYDDEASANSEVVGMVTCKEEECEVINIYEKYVIVKEDNKHYLYDYENNTMEFGPFDIFNSFEDLILAHNNKLYGIIYSENNSKNIYSIEASKTLKNIQGVLLDSSLGLDTTMMYKYGYAIFKNNNVYEFINLNTGNVSYSITGTLNSFIEDTANNIVYITTYNSNNKKITIYNSNGKKLFDGKEFNYIRLFDNNIVVSDDNRYYIYDSKLKLKLTSKEYNNILSIYDDFIVVIDNEYLQIVNLEDQILATYDLKWDSTYTFNTMLSGKTSVDNQDIIYIVVETSSESYRYYYIPSTKEFGLN